MVFSLSALVAGCGGDSAPPAPPPPAIAPTISIEPVAQSVPMGLSATYTVAASGSAVQYQWKKNGTAIAGANSTSYTTPATAFADSGANFSVAISNSAGTIDSAAAALTVSARAPMAGDLRFQQVDAPSTGNGWGNVLGVSTNLLAGNATSYSQSVGTSFYVGNTGNCAVPATTDGLGCQWLYSESPSAVYAGSTALVVNYASGSYANFQADLQDSSWPGIQISGTSLMPASDGSVVTSLDLEPADVLFALSWIQSTQASGFHPNLVSVAPANLPSTAAQEGAAGRVITAISYDAGQVTFLSYGWQADAGTTYESQVVSSSTPNAPAAAANLAAQGYIITASGRADDAGNVLLVGTRVQGDTMARPLMAVQGTGVQALMQQGYSIVAIISGISQVNGTTFILER